MTAGLSPGFLLRLLCTPRGSGPLGAEAEHSWEDQPLELLSPREIRGSEAAPGVMSPGPALSFACKCEKEKVFSLDIFSRSLKNKENDLTKLFMCIFALRL